MGLDPKNRNRLEKDLSECEEAIQTKPHLAKVYDKDWRRGFREKILNEESRNGVSYPSPYAKHLLDVNFPRDYQDRLDVGLGVLWPKLNEDHRRRLISRMRGAGSCSAEDELLLARGFEKVFGLEAISFPEVTANEPVGEFIVTVDGQEIEIEAKTLMEQDAVQKLNDDAIKSGRFCWFTKDQKIGRPQRAGNAIRNKLKHWASPRPHLLVLSQLAAFLMPADAVPIVRELATAPNTSDLPAEKHALAIAYASARRLVGVWINAAVAERLKMNRENIDAIRQAVCESYYPRNDGVFLTEQQNKEEEEVLLARLRNGSSG